MPAAKKATALSQRRTQAERSSETRQKLIAATIAVLIESGFAGTSTPAIALRAGISRGALSHQYATKADLLVAVVDHLVRMFLDRFAIAREPRRSQADRVSQIVDQAWTVYGSDDYFAMLNVMFGAVGDRDLTARLKELTSTIGRELPQVWRSTFADLEIPPERLEMGFRILVDQMRGMALDRAFGRGPRQPDRQLHALKAMIRRGLAGTLPDPSDRSARS